MRERIFRLSQLLKKEISKIISKDFDIPENILVTITRVEISKDLKKAKVFVSIFPLAEEKKFRKILKRGEKFLRRKLGKRIVLKHLPEIEIRPERMTEEADEIEKVLLKLKKEKK